MSVSVSRQESAPMIKPPKPTKTTQPIPTSLIGLCRLVSQFRLEFYFRGWLFFSLFSALDRSRTVYFKLQIDRFFNSSYLTELTMNISLFCFTTIIYFYFFVILLVSIFRINFDEFGHLVYNLRILYRS